MDSLEKGIEEMSFVAAIEQPKDSSATKTLLGGNTSDASRQVLWCASDEICVAAGDKSSKFVNAGSSNSVTATFEGSISPADTYYAAYPYSYVTGFSSNEFSLNLPSTQDYRTDGFDDDSFPMVAKTTGGTFNLLNLCGIFVLNLTGDKSIESLAFSAHKDDGSEIPVAGIAKVSMDYASVPSLSLTGTTHPSVTLACAEPVTLSPSSPTSFHIILPPGTYPSFSIIVYATDGSKMQITSSKPMTINRSNRTVASSLSYKELETYVDLGLSVMWATCNIGADTPEQYGGYYQWAGIQDVTSTSIYLAWSNCPYHTGSDADTGWTKYVPSNRSSYWSGTGSPDNKTVLDPSDDVAHVKLGDKWRIPTDAEWTELRDNCTWTWTTQNGVNGYKVTSKKTGYTNKSIFLPAAGDRDVGSSGHYWSSSLFTNYPIYAFILYFDSSHVYGTSNFRRFGQPVRPVYGDRVSVTGVSLSKTTLSLEIGETYTLSATVAPSNAAEKSVSWTSSNSTVASVDASGKVTAVGEGEAVISAIASDGVTKATCTVTVLPNVDYTQPVDMGLSVKWASCNLGSNNPENYGDYYAWGATEPWYENGYAQSETPVWKSNYSEGYQWENCPYLISGSGSSATFSKYVPSYKSSYWGGSNSPDNRTVLSMSDDAAYEMMGGSWRMPTEEEWTELINTENCIWTWTTQRGVNGYKVTSRKTNNSIFLPAAGSRSSTSLTDLGSRGYYLSSSLNTDYPIYIWCAFLSSSNVYVSYYYRSYGRSVRPVYDDRIRVTSVALNVQSATLDVGESRILSATVYPSNATDKSVSWTTSDSDVATVDDNGKVTAVGAGTATVTVKTLDGGKTATCQVTVSLGSGYVDLGLSVKWATCNLGASVPEEYGDYYTWGDIETYYEDGYAQESSQKHWKSSKTGGYSTENYKFYQLEIAETDIYDNDGFLIAKAGDAVAKGYTKYVPKSYADQYGFKGFYDGKTVLDIEDDVAHVKLGGKWRMPTDAEWDELRNTDNCTWTWTTQNGVNGCKVTSKKNGNSIFLPAAGFRYVADLYNVGSHGDYWSSSLTTYDPNGAFGLHFDSSSVRRSGPARCIGQSVRPVSE